MHTCEITDEPHTYTLITPYPILAPWGVEGLVPQICLWPTPCCLRLGQFSGMHPEAQAQLQEADERVA